MFVVRTSLHGGCTVRVGHLFSPVKGPPLAVRSLGHVHDERVCVQLGIEFPGGHVREKGGDKVPRMDLDPFAVHGLLCLGVILFYEFEGPGYSQFVHFQEPFILEGEDRIGLWRGKSEVESRDSFVVRSPGLYQGDAMGIVSVEDLDEIRFFHRAGKAKRKGAHTEPLGLLFLAILHVIIIFRKVLFSVLRLLGRADAHH